MSRHASLLLLVAALGIVDARSSLDAQEPAAGLLGRWHGTGICVQASWNASCNDEEDFFEFVPAPNGLPQILAHGFRRAGTEIVSMGDQELLPDSGAASWAGEFANSRAHIRLMFQVSDSGLTGAVIQLPSLKVERRYRAQRDSSWTPPPD